MYKRLISILALTVAACVPARPVDVSANYPVECETSDRVGPAQKAAWRDTLRANTPESYRSFLRKYPRSCYAPKALALLTEANRVARPKIATLGPRSGAIARTAY